MKSRIIVFLFLAIAACVGFIYFFPGHINIEHIPKVEDLTAGMLGALITVTITAVLLRYQSISQINRDKSVAIFQEKLKFYEGFCTFLIDIATDAGFNNEQEKELRLWSMRLSLVSGREVSQAIDHFFMQSHRNRVLFYEQLTAEQQKELADWHRSFYGERRVRRDPRECFMSIGALVAHLKHDLGEGEISRLDDITSAKHVVDDILRLRPAT